jgi:hypothetical protein
MCRNAQPRTIHSPTSRTRRLRDVGDGRAGARRLQFRRHRGRAVRAASRRVRPRPRRPGRRRQGGGRPRPGPRLGRLRRPTKAAWLANLLARHRTEQLDGLVALARGLAQAQQELDGSALRALSGQRHRVVAAMARDAGRLAARRGETVNDGLVREVAGILDAALADPAVAEEVRAGRLTKTVRYSGFGPAEGADRGEDMAAVGRVGAAAPRPGVPAVAVPESRATAPVTQASDGSGDGDDGAGAPGRRGGRVGRRAPGPSAPVSGRPRAGRAGTRRAGETRAARRGARRPGTGARRRRGRGGRRPVPPGVRRGRARPRRRAAHRHPRPGHRARRRAGRLPATRNSPALEAFRAAATAARDSARDASAAAVRTARRPRPPGPAPHRVTPTRRPRPAACCRESARLPPRVGTFAAASRRRRPVVPQCMSHPHPRRAAAATWAFRERTKGSPWTDTATLITQLRVLAQLTRAEAHVARVAGGPGEHRRRPRRPAAQRRGRGRACRPHRRPPA